MKTYDELFKSGRAIAAQFGVSKLFATGDNNHFISEHDARSHGKTKGLKVHTLEYGGEGGAASKPAGAEAEAATAAPKKESDQKNDLAAVLDAIGAATNAKELAAAVPQHLAAKEAVMKVLAAKRSLLIKSAQKQTSTASTKVEEVPAVEPKTVAPAVEKKEAAPSETKAVEVTTVAETRTPAEILEAVNGIGRATAIKLVAAGVNTVAELAASDAAELAAKSGVNKALLARAIDGLNK